jgi:hypothetical protein
MGTENMVEKSNNPLYQWEFHSVNSIFRVVYAGIENTEVFLIEILGVCLGNALSPYMNTKQIALKDIPVQQNTQNGNKNI